MGPETMCGQGWIIAGDDWGRPAHSDFDLYDPNWPFSSCHHDTLIKEKFWDVLIRSVIEQDNTAALLFNVT